MANIPKKIPTYWPEILIVIFATLTRFVRLGSPNVHIFDEVYHAFTAQEMLKGNPAAWEWWNTPPQGFAYEWTHPPLAKEFMVIGMKLFGENSFGWRFFSAFFGVGIIILIYFIALKLFKNRILALLAAFVAATDGLLFTMSRIAMNDSYFIFFALLALLCFLYNKKLLTSFALGLALSAKWTGMYAIGIIGILLLTILVIYIKDIFFTNQTENDASFYNEWNARLAKFTTKNIKRKVILRVVVQCLLSFFYLLCIPIAVYLASYIPFFLGHHSPPDQDFNNWQTFIGLQQQMWWYHTGLKATHDYQSVPWQWMLDLRPVWFYVEYKDTTIGNIYNLGNPLFQWFGAVSVLFVIWDFVKKRTFNLAFIIIGYLGFFLPWVASPRIMFYYHYTPAVPFLALAAGYVLNEFLIDKFGKIFVIVMIVLLTILFVYFYPLWTGLQVPKEFNDTYYWFKSWK